MKTADNHIENELTPLAPGLAAAGRQMPYGLPEGYFDNFAGTMLLRVKEQDAPGVPGGYFDHFAADMLKKVRGNEVKEELEAISPLLNTLSKTMPYSLPKGYFEQWKPMLSAETKPQPAKVISLKSGLNWKHWAAAAAVVLTLGLGWQFFANQPESATSTASVNPAEVDTLLTVIDENSLTGYLENEQTNAEFTSLLTMAEQDIETGVKQLSNEELNWYLENQAVSIPGS